MSRRRSSGSLVKDRVGTVVADQDLGDVRVGDEWAAGRRNNRHSTIRGHTVQRRAVGAKPVQRRGGRIAAIRARFDLYPGRDDQLPRPNRTASCPGRERLNDGEHPPVLGVVPVSKAVADPECRAFNDRVIRRIEATREPVVVVLAANLTPRVGVRLFDGDLPEQMFIDVAARNARDAQKELGRSD